jgi:hypothetical protein
VATAACAAAIVVAVIDPNEPGHYPTCPVLAMTGLYCTGCGTLRAVHDVLRGDLVGALHMNPLMLMMAPFAIATWAAWTIRAATGRPRTWAAPPWALYVTAGALVLFTVLRNIPFLAPWLAPGGG